MRRRSGALALGLVVLVSAAVRPISAHALTAEEIERASASATSGLDAVVERLAADDLEGRDNDTPASVRAQRYLIARLRRLGPGLGTGGGLGNSGGLGSGAGLGGGGLGSTSGDDAYRQPFEQSGKRGTNLLALIRGRELPDEVVVVGAHYDHLGVNCDHSPGGRVCNGATDNAAGVAVVLAIGSALKNLPEAPRRSVVLALWDAEEDGLLGSFYYVGHPAVPLARTVAYVNFDIQGSDLLPSLADVSFAVGAETGGAALVDPVRRAIAAEGLDTELVSYIFGQLRSDYANFVGASVPTVFFSDSTGACYHTSGDDFRLVDQAKLRRQSRIGFRVAATLAETDAPPGFVPPNPALATYDDAVAINDTAMRGRADLALFPPADQALITDVASRLQAIVAAGPQSFDATAAQTVINAALSTIDALTRLPCPGAPPTLRRLPLAPHG